MQNMAVAIPFGFILYFWASFYRPSGRNGKTTWAGNFLENKQQYYLYGQQFNTRTIQITSIKISSLDRFAPCSAWPFLFCAERLRYIKRDFRWHTTGIRYSKNRNFRRCDEPGCPTSLEWFNACIRIKGRDKNGA